MVTGMERWLLKIIRIEFPGHNDYPKGANGFATSASGKEASDSICLREPCGQPA
ncbi:MULTISPECIES: hypothetical protein [Butyricimonas]|uniref:hypothetical protein n=1 Tax=Butyricimonas TaxID=574697 RepID=UPI0003731D9F|nr:MULTISPECIES: hypothetical protein [Butyricimonas]